MKRLFGFAFLLVFVLTACSTIKKGVIDTQNPFATTIQAHGGEKYKTASIAFEFRKKTYTLKNNGGSYEYTVDGEKNGQKIYDVLNNEGFTRKVNGEVQNLDAKKAKSYGNTLNSVLYFAQLPYKLDDPAVFKTSKGNTTITGKNYEVIEVRFSEEGGGTDHDDVFYYWINTQTKLIDYLAYEFHVNKGGIRFRSAYNPRRVGGIHFQDYVNYKAEVGTPMVDLPKLYEKGALKELSKIELENVRILK